jgi:hypothetical protein
MLSPARLGELYPPARAVQHHAVEPAAGACHCLDAARRPVACAGGARHDHPGRRADPRRSARHHGPHGTRAHRRVWGRSLRSSHAAAAKSQFADPPAADVVHRGRHTKHRARRRRLRGRSTRRRTARTCVRVSGMAAFLGRRRRGRACNGASAPGLCSWSWPMPKAGAASPCSLAAGRLCCRWGCSLQHFGSSLPGSEAILRIISTLSFRPSSGPRSAMASAARLSPSP